MIPTFLIVQKLGMLDTIWAIVLPSLISTWYLFIMRTFFEAPPEELEDDRHRRMRVPANPGADCAAVIRAGHGHDRPVYGCESMELLFSALIYLNDRDMYPRKL